MIHDSEGAWKLAAGGKLGKLQVPKAKSWGWARGGGGDVTIFFVLPLLPKK
jgi:hypothetical protein